MIKLRMIFVIIFFILIITPIYAIDMSVEIPNQFKNVIPGEPLYFTFQLKDPEILGRHDILLKYEIIKDNETITSLEETVAIETQASFVKSISIPNTVKSGIYYLSVNAEGSQARISFNVNSNWLIIFSVSFNIISMLILAFIIFEIYKINEKLKKIEFPKKRINY